MRDFDLKMSKGGMLIEKKYLAEFRSRGVETRQ